MTSLQREIAEIREEPAENVTPYALGWFRGIHAVFGGAVVGIVAWLQSSLSATASMSQIAMQPMLFVALGGSILGLIASIGLYYIWAVIESTHRRSSAEVRVRTLIGASMQTADDLVLRQELLETSTNRSDQAKANASKLRRCWVSVGAMVGLALTIVISGVSGALWFAYQAQTVVG